MLHRHLVASGWALLCILGLACVTLRLGSADDALLGARGKPIDLRPPDDRSLAVEIQKYESPKLRRVGGLLLFAYEYAAHVYERPSTQATTLGVVRRGTALRAMRRVNAPGCRRGTWYAIEHGYACAGRGFTTRAGTRRQRRPNLSRAVPFEYGRIKSRQALRFYRVPDQQEEAAIASALAGGRKFPEVVAQQLDGDYFVAIDTLLREGERKFYRTVPGRVVRESDVDIKPEPSMRGELLRPQTRLPIAFVFGEPAVPLLRKRGEHLEQIGRAYRHARFPLKRLERWHGTEYAIGPRGMAVESRHVRIARARRRPAGISREVRWIHVDLGSQTLVAYRGDTPVFATLATTGREGYETPTGLFRIREKHKTATMRGEDPVDGPYEVSEVPWTMYYSGSYALHGAYWHDDFGKTRSHGCTNLAPADARWLFQYTAGEIPNGWHAVRQLEGTHVYIE
jgi:L,D-transpeptidase catalytic domain